MGPHCIFMLTYLRMLEDVSFFFLFIKARLVKDQEVLGGFTKAFQLNSSQHTPIYLGSFVPRCGASWGSCCPISLLLFWGFSGWQPDLLIQIANDVKQDWTQYLPLGSLMVTGFQVIFSQLIIILWAQPFWQLSTYMSVYLSRLCLNSLSPRALW